MTANSGFRAFFFTQLLGALNANFFRSSLVALIALRNIQLGDDPPSQLLLFSGLLLVVPVLMFSPLAGHVADAFEKSKIIRSGKILELFLMSAASIGIWYENALILFGVLFLLGVQTAFLGPIKYSAIPDLVDETELPTANAFVEFGTFLGILIGTVIGGLAAVSDDRTLYLTVGLFVLAGCGYSAALAIPQLPAGDPHLSRSLGSSWNPLSGMLKLITIVKKDKAVSKSVLGIAWFWFFGVGVISVLPMYVKEFLRADEAVLALFLAMFTIGITLGVMICARLCYNRAEVGLVPIGSLGMTLFSFDLFYSQPEWIFLINDRLTVHQFIAQPFSDRLLFDFMMMGLFAGFFLLPLYTFLQERSISEFRSRVIAGSDMANALLVILSSILVLTFHHFKLNTAQIFAVLTVLNVVVAIYIYSLVPEFTLRFQSWLVSNLLYRVHVEGLENIPKRGACILASNHVTYVDWLLIYGACKRPARFVMYFKFFEIPLIRLLMKQAKVIPIAGKRESPEILEKAFESIASELKNGQVVCIFPEGSITYDGRLIPLRSGIQRMLELQPCPVVPVVLTGLWGSIFSRSKSKAPPHRRKVGVTFHPPIQPENFSLQKLEELFVKEL